MRRSASCRSVFPARPPPVRKGPSSHNPRLGRGGQTNAEISDELHISLSTVKTHLFSLMGKLKARNRIEFAIWAHETGRI